MPIKAVLFDLDDTLIDWSGFKGSWWELEPRHLRHVYQYIHANVHPLNVSSEVFVEEFSRRSRENWDLARDSLISPHLGKLLTETAQALGVPEDRLDHDRFLTEYRWHPGDFPFKEEVLQIKVDDIKIFSVFRLDSTYKDVNYKLF